MSCILPLLLCIYAVCNVLYFILSDDDFEIKSKIYSLDHALRLVLIHILNFKMTLLFGICFFLCPCIFQVVARLPTKACQYGNNPYFILDL